MENDHFLQLRRVSKRFAGVQALREVDFDVRRGELHCLAGENGSGKSTLMEGLAAALGMNPEGGSRHLRFTTVAEERVEKQVRLADAMTVERLGRPATDFFLRAESFFNVATALDAIPGALGPYGGTSLHDRSHGESFLATLNHRFGARGLYLLDEPESALSFRGCLALLRIVADGVRAGSQFVIATHNPVVLAYPGALIYAMDDEGIRRVTYDESDLVRSARDFLAAPDRYLRPLLADD
jgi:predicted ATPase